jgi:HEAT repeat protein
MSVTEVFQTLIEQLHHPDKNVRSSAVFALEKLDDAGVADALIQALGTEPDFFVREDMTWALVRLGEPAFQKLVAALGDSQAAGRPHMAHTLSKMRDARAVDVLLAVLHDPDIAVVRKAVFALGQIGEARAISAITVLLGHEDEELQTTLTQTLEKFGASAVPDLLRAMEDERPAVREQAAHILGQIGGEEAVTALVNALNDTQWQVRFAVVTALGYVGGEQARAALQTLQDDPHPRVRGLVPKVLARMKHARPVARPELLQSFDTPHSPTPSPLRKEGE